MLWVRGRDTAAEQDDAAGAEPRDEGHGGVPGGPRSACVLVVVGIWQVVQGSSDASGGPRLAREHAHGRPARDQAAGSRAEREYSGRAVEKGRA